MSSQFATVEDQLIALIKTTLGNKVRVVDWAPPDWDEDFIKRILLNLPGVLVIFDGGARSDDTDHAILLDTQWSVVAATRHVDAKNRARGDAREIGCYEILQVLAPAIDGFTAGNVTCFKLTSWNNEAALKLEKQALMIQTLTFTARIEIENAHDPSLLVPFITYHDTFIIGQQPGAPSTEDYVELEQ